MVAGSVAAPIIIECRSQAQLPDAQAALSAQSDELAIQVAESERLSNLLAQANEARELSASDATELLRLRGGVGSLRRQTNDLARLQADNQRLRAAARRPMTAPATAQDKKTHEYIQKESWAFLGFAEPESAFQSTVWAMINGEAKTFLTALSPEGDNFKRVEGQSESDLAAKNKAEMEKVTAYKILDKEPVSDSEVIITVYAQGEDGLRRFRLQRLGDERDR